MPRSFLVKKVKCDDTKSYHYRSSRDIITAYDESLDSIKALTPFTPCAVPSLPLSVRVSNGYISELVVPSLPQDAKTAQVEEDPMVMQIQPAHVEIHPHAGCEDNHVNDSDHFSDTSSNSALDLTIDRDLKKDIESRVTIGYTYDAFFISDGRSRKKNSFGIPERIAKQRYTCSECGKDYATSSNLSRHKQTHRSLDSQLAKTCPHCDKVYVSMPALSMHILTHELKHKCEICGKAFSRPWLLHGHKRSHTGEKPYGCAHCGKAFADRSNLRAHMQTHSAFKHYTCKRCNKSFALKSYLNKHYESACIKDDSDSTSVCSMGSSQS